MVGEAEIQTNVLYHSCGRKPGIQPEQHTACTVNFTVPLVPTNHHAENSRQLRHLVESDEVSDAAKLRVQPPGDLSIKGHGDFI